MAGEVQVAVILLAALAVTTAVVLIRRRGDRDAVTRRAFRSASRRLIKDVRDGELVVLAGTVSCEDPVQAAFSGRACAYYELVEERDMDQQLWVEQAREHHGADFALDDGTGEALIMVQGAEVLLMKDQEKRWSLAVDFFARKREGVVLEGHTVAVVGRGNWEPDPRPSRSAGYRERPTVLVVRGMRRRPLRITNSPAILSSAAHRRGSSTAA